MFISLDNTYIPFIPFKEDNQGRYRNCGDNRYTESEFYLKVLKERYLSPAENNIIDLYWRIGTVLSSPYHNRLYDDIVSENIMDYLEDNHNHIILYDELKEYFKASYVYEGKINPQFASLFIRTMYHGLFIPGGRTLANAGIRNITANCVVLPIKDTLSGDKKITSDSIFGTLHLAASLQQAGSGIGYEFSSLRPERSLTERSKGYSSGPVSFMQIYDRACEVIKNQGRHGANMGTFDCRHPDLLKFISCKDKEGFISNFNISVMLTDVFMHRAMKVDDCSTWIFKWPIDQGKEDPSQKIIDNPEGQPTKRDSGLTAKEILNKIGKQAWKNGEPGVLFIDKINAHNPLPLMGPIRATNPCAEMPLHAYDSCNLGSINLASHMRPINGIKVPGTENIETYMVNFNLLKNTTKIAVLMLDAVIDLFEFPVHQVQEMASKNRRIGIGIMGFADACALAKIKYGSTECLLFAEKIMKVIKDTAYTFSSFLGIKLGNFPNISFSIHTNVPMRNCAHTTCPPTGTTSIISGVNSGIEPFFRLSYSRYMSSYLKPGENPKYIDVEFPVVQYFQKIYKKMKVDEYIPTSDKLTYMDHIKVQAAFQKYCDTGISKTINLKSDATEADITDAFIYAYISGCMGCTVYRDKSRESQVLCEKCVE